MSLDNGLDADCSYNCSHIDKLKKELETLKKTLNRGVYRYCPNCGSGMVKLSTKDKLICDCGIEPQPYKLKKGQKSILENRIGE